MKQVVLQIILGWIVLGSGAAFAGGVRNFSGSWPINNQIARLLLQPEFGQPVKPPAVMVSVGQGRLFDMPELGQTFLAVRGSMKLGGIPLEAGGLWEKTGSALFVEDRLRGDFLWGRSPSFGLSVEYLQQNLGGQIREARPDFNLLWAVSFGYNSLKGRLHLQWPIDGSAKALGERGRQDLLNLVIHSAGLAAALVIDRQPNGTPQMGFHFLLTLHSGIGLELRIDGPTGSLGPGLTITRGALMVRTSHVVHPHLGITHRLILVMGKFSGGA